MPPSRPVRRVVCSTQALCWSANVQPHRGRPGLLATMTRLSSTPLSSSSRRASTRTSASQVAGAAVPGGSTDGVPGEPGFWALGGCTGGLGEPGNPWAPPPLYAGFWGVWLWLFGWGLAWLCVMLRWPARQKNKHNTVRGGSSRACECDKIFIGANMLLLLQSQVSNGAGPSAAGLVYEREFGTGPTAAKLWVCCRTSTPFKIAVILYIVATFPSSSPVLSDR